MQNWINCTEMRMHSLLLVHALLFMVRAWWYSVTSAGSGIVHGGGEPAAYMYKQHIHAQL